eukprot:s1463_g15.t1
MFSWYFKSVSDLSILFLTNPARQCLISPIFNTFCALALVPSLLEQQDTFDILTHVSRRDPVVGQCLISPIFNTFCAPVPSAGPQPLTSSSWACSSS